MRRAPWGIFFALLLGAGAGLGYAWVISPHPMTAAQPSALRTDFKDQYRSLIAAAYAATGNLPRAEARLAVLGDADPVDALHAQAQRMLANTETIERADHLVDLAAALDAEASGASLSTPTLEIVMDAGETFTPSPAPLVTEDPSFSSETPEFVEAGTTVVETQSGAGESIVRPTPTSTTAPGKPFT
ncbi:MAG TPA: hypothetical protein VFY83_13435, partial [Anaerolineales bacterium]|nr:hypothetical protein [Anaerolineales bacterium]